MPATKPHRRRQGANSAPERKADDDKPQFTDEQLDCSPDSYIIPATDDHGHTSKEWVRLQPTMDRAMQILIERKIFPYKTKSDIIRHAVHLHMPWLEAKAEQIGKAVPAQYMHFMACCNMIIATMQDTEYNQQMEKTFKAMQEKVGYHVDRGEITMAMHTLNKARRLMELMEDSPWKAKFSELFGAKYGHLLQVKNAPRAGQRILAPDEELEVEETSSDEDESDSE